jgi:hypothetical protein
VPFHAGTSPVAPHQNGDPHANLPDELQTRVKAGDIVGVIDLITLARPGVFSPGQLDCFLHSAIEHAGLDSPRKFTAQLHRLIASSLAHIYGRLLVAKAKVLATHDSYPSHDRARLPEQFTQDILPPLERVARLLAETSHCWASENRLWELAERDQPPKRPLKAKDRNNGGSYRRRPSGRRRLP